MHQLLSLTASSEAAKTKAIQLMMIIALITTARLDANM